MTPTPYLKRGKRKKCPACKARFRMNSPRQIWCAECAAERERKRKR